jgi:hypothetical protein
MWIISSRHHPGFVNLLYATYLGMGFCNEIRLAELAGSSAPIAQSETMIARQRALIARVQIETNVRLMHKVHQFIKVRNPLQGERI